MTDRLPTWFKKKIPAPGALAGMKTLFDTLSLHTVCQSALCPNLGDCFQRRTATFLLLGDICTRNCTFCAVHKGVPDSVDQEEPLHITQAVRQMGLTHVVLTSVTRDDISDGGAGHFAQTIARLREIPGVTVEVLIPDFAGSSQALEQVADANPEVINHNLETVPRLYPEVRPKADFRRSLRLLQQVKSFDARIITKSGIMLGLGETRDETLETMKALRTVSCDLLTIGQYLQPSASHHPVVSYVSPEEFLEYEKIGIEMGFGAVASAPLVRSSFNAGEIYQKAMAKKGVSQ